MTVSKKAAASAAAKEPAVDQPVPIKAPEPMLPAVVVPGLPAPASLAQGSGRRPWLWVLAVVLLAGIAGLLYAQPWVADLPMVGVETVAPGPVKRVLAVNGRIAGERSVDVRPQVSGTLAEILVEEGATVQSGTALAVIDPAAQQAAVRQAMAGLDAAQVAEAEARATFARNKALGGTVARVVLETAERKAQAAAQETARMAAVLDQAQIQLEKFTIRAPLSGSVLGPVAEPGQIVDLATRLMTIADLGHLVIKTDVDEAYATQVAVGQPVVLQLSGETRLRDGQVSFVSQRVDASTGGLEVRLMPAAPLAAPIGLTVTANITVDDLAAAITVPRAAILRDATGDRVLVVTQGIAVARAVEVIDWPAARLIVTEGLTPGDIVITDATGLADGQAVMIAP